MANLCDLTPPEALKLLKEGNLSVGVFGFGHVGLPLGIAWCNAGANVIGVTKEQEHIKLIEGGESPYPEEEGLVEGIRRALQGGCLRVTDDAAVAAKETDLKIITVPIPFDPPKSVDFTALRDVGAHIGKTLKRGDIVDLESSVPPGTTNGTLKPLLETHSGLKNLEDFGLIYSPERIFVGRALKDITESYEKVVGSDSAKALSVMSTFYGQISQKGVRKMSSIAAAEIEKLFEGAYRDVNISLANELADLASRLGVSYYEVKNAANSQPFCHLHDPGLGVGGFCIPVYSRYIIARASEGSIPTPIVKMARINNEGLPKKRAFELLELMRRTKINPKRAKVAVLGLSFRGNTGDIRLSPGIDFVNVLATRVADIVAYDPLAVQVRFRHRNVRRVHALEEALSGASAVCVTAEHEEFAQLTFARLAEKLKKPTVIVDYKKVVRGDIPRDPALVCRIVGEPSTQGS